MSSCSLVVWTSIRPQPKVTVGTPWAVIQLASRPPLLTAHWINAEVVDRRLGFDHAGLVVGEAEGLVIEMAVERHAAGFSLGAFHLLRGIAKRLFDGFYDAAAKRGAVAAGLGAGGRAG